MVKSKKTVGPHVCNYTKKDPIVGVFMYKVLAEFNMFGETRRDEKTKTVFEKKRICDAIMTRFNFFFVSTKVS